MPTRSDFQHLTAIREGEVVALLATGCWDGAYYLAGYVVECALKACIAKLTKAEDFPPPKKIVEQCYTHELETLVRRADLLSDLDTALKVPDFQRNWFVVKAWTEEARYKTWASPQAQAMWSAVSDPSHGVLPWIKSRW